MKKDEVKWKIGFIKASRDPTGMPGVVLGFVWVPSGYKDHGEFRLVSKYLNPLGHFEAPLSALSEIERMRIIGINPLER